jgi:hypothetical protein
METLLRRLPQPPLRLRPYAYVLFVLWLIPTALWLDSLTRTIWQQDILGLLSFLILVACSRYSSRIERRQVWIMVCVATCIEIWSSVIWGIYRYRFHNMPYLFHGVTALCIFCVTGGPHTICTASCRGFQAHGLHRRNNLVFVRALCGTDGYGTARRHRSDFLSHFAWFMRRPRPCVRGRLLSPRTLRLSGRTWRIGPGVFMRP